MRRHFDNQAHSVQMLFTISLFLVFLISAISVIICGARVYENTSADSRTNYEIRTSLSYITEKIRQNDTAGGVGLQTFDATTAITMHSTYDAHDYITYIYYYDGSLRELFTASENTFMPEAGTVITKISGMTMTEQTHGSILITILDSSDRPHTILVHPNTLKGDSQ